MRRLAVTALIVGLNIGCQHSAVQAPNPSVARTWMLSSDVRDIDLVCIPDKFAPALMSCMTVKQFKGLLNSVRAN